jgi:hypothetical protein
VDIYYAHPWSWDESGYGGPAYPRAYMRLERGEPEPWEVEECRYEWEAPRAALSDVGGTIQTKAYRPSIRTREIINEGTDRWGF